ncbi:transglycosylase domain-containing protein [Streptomyces odontomachi]|uniref:transglycosylase domain-containing protein n=1 Tax=Streptomyces odontomachi TaxID=2944940 RepID=UPI0021091D76|nr:transglycosylase domain-containing protein [Streptomyces sp. ODS25]
MLTRRLISRHPRGRRRARKAAGRPPAFRRLDRCTEWLARIRPGWTAKLRPRYPRPGRTGLRRWLPSLRQTLLAGLWVTLTLVTAVGITYARTRVPADLNAFATQQDNVYYWADGTEMARVGPVDRQAMSLDRIPSDVQWAVLAAENASFYSDHGISPKGIGRAVYAMATGGETQGGSTITQQYVKNVYLNQQQTLSRKITEMFLSVKIDQRMGKQQILEGYLNTSWFGRGAYGVQRAATAYYGKDVTELNASEGAVLATLLKGAGNYDPAISAANHKRAVDRWKWVLDRMVSTGHLSPAERATYRTFPEPIAPPKPAGLDGQIGYLVDTAREYAQLRADISDAQFALGGYQIHTTFEKRRVDALAAAVPKSTSALHPKTRHADRNVRVGAATVATDGRILALYGGPGYLTQAFNDADIRVVPAGTVYAPFVYAAGLRDGRLLRRDAPRAPLTPDTRYDADNKVPVRTPEGPYWDRNGKIVKIANDGNRSWGTISIAKAMAESVNVPVVQLGMDVGLDRVRRASVDAGLLPTGFGAQAPTFALGATVTPSPIRLAGAYGTFLASGTHTDPYSVLRITQDGAAVTLHRPAVTHPFSSAVAHDVTAALYGHDTPAPVDGHEGAAGRAGTSPDGKAGWFVGYDPSAVTAVALFRIEPKTQQVQSLKGLAGQAGTAAARTLPEDIWKSYTKTASAAKSTPKATGAGRYGY